MCWGEANKGNDTAAQVHTHTFAQHAIANTHTYTTPHTCTLTQAHVPPTFAPQPHPRSLRSYKQTEKATAIASVQSQLLAFMDFHVSLAVFNPLVLAVGHVVQLDVLQHVEEQPPSRDHWRSCVIELGMTKEQVGTPCWILYPRSCNAVCMACLGRRPQDRMRRRACKCCLKCICTHMIASGSLW